MRMSAGRLRDLVTIKKRLPSRTGTGAASTVRTQRCRMEPLSGREVEVGAISGQERDLRMIFRVAPAVARRDDDGNELFIVDADSVEYEIVSVEPQPYPERTQIVYVRRVNR